MGLNLSGGKIKWINESIAIIKLAEEVANVIGLLP